MAPSFQALHCWKQLLTHVGVGMGAASFWRGAWYVLDDQLFPENPNLSALSSLALGTGGMAASQGIVARAMAVKSPLLKRVARFGALYTVAMSCVLVWRGTWVGWDCVYEHYHNEWMATHKQKSDGESETESTANTPTVLFNKMAATAAANSQDNSSLLATSSSALEHGPAGFAIKSTDPGHLTYSGLASHTFAIVALGACGVFASVLAPPAAVSVIKDLAIQASRKTSRRSGTTTTFMKSNSRKEAEIKNRAFEYLPFIAGDLSRSAPTSASTMTTAAQNGKMQTTASMIKRS